MLLVESIILRAGEEPVYNFEVDRDHVYRLGKKGLLVHNASSYEVRPYPPLASPTTYAILDVTLKGWVTVGAGSAAVVQIWTNAVTARTEANNLTKGISVFSGLKPIATPITAKTKTHIYGLEWNAAMLSGGHHAPSVITNHPTFNVGGTDYVVFIATYNSAALQSRVYSSAIQLLQPCITPTPGRPERPPALFAEKASSTFFPDTWTTRQIEQAIKEALIDSWVNNRTPGAHFEGREQGGLVIEEYFVLERGKPVIRTATPK